MSAAAIRLSPSLDTPSRMRRPDPIAVIAHDMRGPLANLSLIIEDIATRERNGERGADRLTKAMKVIERLDRLITSVIDSTRGPMDPTTTDRWAVSVPDLVEETAALNEPLARQCGVRLHVYTVEPLQVIGDGHALMRALDNLITNAIKHSPRGGLVLVQATVDDDNAIISVEDDGPGFSDEDIERAFRPFAKLSAISNSTIQSSGLGLSIVKDIAKNHGGSVEIARRSPRPGARVTLTLPRSS